MVDGIGLRAFYRKVEDNPDYDWESRTFGRLYLRANDDFRKFIDIPAVNIKDKYITKKRVYL